MDSERARLLDKCRRNGVTEYELEYENQLTQQNHHNRLEKLLLRKQNDALVQENRQLRALASQYTPAENYTNSEQQNWTENMRDGQEVLQPEFVMMNASQLAGQVMQEGQQQNIGMQSDNQAIPHSQNGDPLDLNGTLRPLDPLMNLNDPNQRQNEEGSHFMPGAYQGARQIAARPRRRHSCQYCGNTFSSRAYLRDHEKHQHVEGRVDCLVCSKSYGSKQSYRNHYKKKHSIQFV